MTSVLTLQTQTCNTAHMEAQSDVQRQIPPSQSVQPPHKHWSTILIITIIIVFTATAAYFVLSTKATKKSIPATVQIPSPTAVLDETVNWKTYKDEVEELSFQYPPNWEIRTHYDPTEGSPPTFGPKNDKQYDMFISPFTSNKQLDMFLNSYKMSEGMEPSKEGVILLEEKINGIEIIKKTYRYSSFGKKNTKTEVFFLNIPAPNYYQHQLKNAANGFRVISFERIGTDTSNLELEKTFMQILSTFTFSDNQLSSQEKQQIDAWIKANNLNVYGDPIGTIYTGGTPLFNEMTGKSIDKYEYILEKHPDRPWTK